MFHGLPELHVEGLPPEEARRLLLSTVAGPVAASVADRLVAETGGNPLALLELAGELTEQDMMARPSPGRDVLEEPLPIGRRLEERYLRRVRREMAARSAGIPT